MLSSPLKAWGEFFLKNAFHEGEGGTEGRVHFWTNLCETNLQVVHWCVDRDVGS